MPPCRMSRPSTVLRRLIEYYSRSYLEDYPDPRSERRALAARRGAGPRPDAREREQLLRTRPRPRLHGRARPDRAAHLSSIAMRSRTRERPTIPGASCPRRSARPPGCPPRTSATPVMRRSCRPATRCHAANESQVAADVLMPAIGVCRECHGSGDRHRNPEGLVQSGCTLCHGFHDAAHGAWTRAPRNEGRGLALPRQSPLLLAACGGGGRASSPPGAVDPPPAVLRRFLRRDLTSLLSVTAVETVLATRHRGGAGARVPLRPSRSSIASATCSPSSA